MPWKVTFFFQQQTAWSSGWSENFWNTLSDLSDVIGSTNSLRPKLQAVHGRQTILPYVRISEVGNFRRVHPISYGVGGFNPTVPAEAPSDFPTTSLLLVMQRSPNYITRQWIRGIPDHAADNGGFFAPGEGYQASINALAGELKNGARGWALRTLDKDVPKKDVLTLSSLGIVGVNDHGYITGDKVRISRARGLTYANKIWKVIRVDTNTFSLVGWDPPEPIPTYRGHGISQKQVYLYATPTTVTMNVITKHNVGRPTRLSVGRRRRRK